MVSCIPAESCELIKLIIKQFLCCYPVNNIDWESFRKHLSELDDISGYNHQDVFVSETLKSTLLEKYPIKTSYQRAFLKKLVSEIDDFGVVHTAIYEAIILLPSYTDYSESCYKHFAISPDKFITLKESLSIVSHGTTGLNIWEGGLVLSEWAFQNKHLFKGKHILELGSGTGFTGLALCLSDVLPKSYIFSDCNSQVINQLQHNININSSTGETVGKLNKTKIKVLALDWEEAEYLVIDKQLKPDLIIAADVVYDERLFAPLCKALKHFLSYKDTFALLACTVRNQETLEKFLHTLRLENLSTVKEEDTKNNIFYYRSTVPVHIYSVKHGTHGG